MQGEVLERKAANFFAPGAQARVGLDPAAAGAVADYGKQHGGLWVGGAVVLTSEALAFEVNALNRRLHQSLPGLHAPLDQIVEVTDRFGILTRIVDVRFADGALLSFRCFGARAFAGRIRAAAQQARH